MWGDDEQQHRHVFKFNATGGEQGTREDVPGAGARPLTGWRPEPALQSHRLTCHMSAWWVPFAKGVWGRCHSRIRPPSHPHPTSECTPSPGENCSPRQGPPESQRAREPEAQQQAGNHWKTPARRSRAQTPRSTYLITLPLRYFC